MPGTILETRATPPGRVLGPGGEPLAANYDVFCIVDWSPDSRYLLVAEVISPLGSDVVAVLYWSYDRSRRRPERLDLSYLRRALGTYWGGRA